MALFAAACDSAPTPLAPTDHDLSFEQGLPGNVPSAGGHADITVGNLTQAYSFNAHEVGQANDTKGEWELSQVLAGTGAKLHGTVVCFTTYANLAFIVGVVDRSDNPAYSVGDGVSWSVQDNGEGAKATGPDLASPMVVTKGGPSINLCNLGYAPLPTLPEDNGNIQVRGVDFIPS